MSTWFHRVFKPSAAREDTTDRPEHVSEPQPPAIEGSLATNAGAERRSCARVSLELQVSLRFETAEAMIASRTFDISRSGAFIAIKEPRPRGTRVRLTIEVDDTTVVLGGVVVRASDGRKSVRRGMSIQFTEVTPEASDALARLLEPRGG